MDCSSHAIVSLQVHGAGPECDGGQPGVERGGAVAGVVKEKKGRRWKALCNFIWQAGKRLFCLLSWFWDNDRAVYSRHRPQNTWERRNNENSVHGVCTYV